MSSRWHLSLHTLLWVVLLWPGLAHAQFLIAPHLQNAQQDGVTFVWAMESSESGVVTIDSVGDFSSLGIGELHEVTVTGLDPATSYDYTIESGDAVASGAFTTAPSNPLVPFSFVVLGDTRSGHDDHQAVIDGIADELPLGFAVHTGDMVSSGEEQADWTRFFEIESALNSAIPWYPVIGNHEEDEGRTPVWFTDYLAPPVDSSGMEEYYAFTYANSAFIVLDHHVNVESRLFGLWTDFSADQLSWLESVLDDYSSDPTIQHIFLFAHEPPYSSNEGRNGSHAMRLLNGTLADHGVDAVFTGHDHYLERGESPEGVPYFVMGGGGAPIYDNESEGHLGYKFPSALPWLDDGHTVDFAASSFGFALIEIENGQVDITIKDELGGVLDAISWNTGDVEPPTDPDAGVDAGTPDAAPDAALDAGVGDAEPYDDAGRGDAEPHEDSGAGDAEPYDDGGSTDDAGPIEAGVVDSGNGDDGGREAGPHTDSGEELPHREEPTSGCSCRASSGQRHVSITARLIELMLD